MKIFKTITKFVISIPVFVTLHSIDAGAASAWASFCYGFVSYATAGLWVESWEHSAR